MTLRGGAARRSRDANHRPVTDLLLVPTNKRVLPVDLGWEIRGVSDGPTGWCRGA